MPTPIGPRDIKFRGPATYRILVQGTLSEHWCDRLAGLKITTACCGDAASRTTLVGAIRDQTELAGVLETLYELHLPILKVECVEDETDTPTN